MDISFEGFFIRKIRQGLSDSSELSQDEEQLLLTPVAELASSAKFSPEIARSLNEKCIKALTNAYKEDTAQKNKGAAMVWAEHNKNLYEHSQLTISGIVQNWYLDVGRSLEKQVIRGIGFWIMIVVLLVLILGALYWFFSW